MRKYLSIVISIIAFFAIQSVVMAQDPEYCTVQADYFPNAVWECWNYDMTAHVACTVPSTNADDGVFTSKLYGQATFVMPVDFTTVVTGTSIKIRASFGDPNGIHYRSGWKDDSGVWTWGTIQQYQTKDNVEIYVPNLGEGVVTTIPAGEHVTAVAFQNTRDTASKWMQVSSAYATFAEVCTAGGGGGGGCDTVDDAEFNITDDSSPWTLLTDTNPDYVNINGAMLQLRAPRGLFVGAMQNVDARYHVYTATVKAQAFTISPTMTVDVGFRNADSSVIDATTIELTNYPNTYQVVITKSTELIGDDTYLYVMTGDGDVDVDYICIEAQPGQCSTPTDKTFSYDDGTLKAWMPIQSDNAYGYGDTDYKAKSFTFLQDINGGWHQKLASEFEKLYTVVASMFFGKYLDGINFPTLNLDYIFDNGKSANDMYLQSSDNMALDEVAVTFAYNKLISDVAIDVLTNDGSTEVGSYEFHNTAFLDPYLGGGVESVTVPLTSPASPTDYMIVVRSVGSRDFSLFGSGEIYVTDITTTGCYYGSAFSSQDCVVLDEDLDGGENGEPDGFYWNWSDSTIVGQGEVTLFSEYGDWLSQNTFTASPGNYYASIQLEHIAGNDCQLRLVGSDPEDGTVDFDRSVQCTPGISQTVTTQLALPINPFELKLVAERGTMNISHVCLTQNINGCLNDNPYFYDGLTAYSTDGAQMSSGGVLLSPGQMVAATGVPYSANPTTAYQLQITASPVTSDTVVKISDDPSTPPSVLDPGVSISSTTVITHIHTATTNAATGKMGPFVYNWNNPYGSTMAVTEYCVTPYDGEVYYGGKNCTTVENADFDEGLTGWTVDNVSHAGSYAIFGGAGGSVVGTTVHVSEVTENLITNPSFEIDTAGWYVIGSATIESDASQHYIGSASARYLSSDATGNGRIYSPVGSVSAGETMTYSAMVKATNGSVAIRLSGALSGIMYYSGSGEWENLSVTAVAASDGAVYAYMQDYRTSGWDAIYIDTVQATKTAIQQTYHDGDMPWCEWTGTPHASTTKCAAPFDATVHIIGKSPLPTPITATVTVSSTGGVRSATNQFDYGMIPTEHFDNFTVGGGDMVVQVAAPAGFELDYVCVIPGEFTEPGEPGTGGGITIGDGQCAPPPMTIKDNLPISGWLEGTWIWDSATPSNYEIVGAYSAGWLRYIGCTLTQIGVMVEGKLDTIISQLKALLVLQGIDSLASVISAIADSVNLLEQTVGDLINTLVADGVSLAAILAALLLFFGALMAVLALIIGIIYLFWMIPQEFFTSFWAAIHSPDAIALPLPVVQNGVVVNSITDIPYQTTDPFMNIYKGMHLFNQTISPTWMLTITVIVISIGSISLVWWTVRRVGLKW